MVCDGWIPAGSGGSCPVCGRDIWEDEAVAEPLATLRIEREPIVHVLLGTLERWGPARRLQDGVAFAVDGGADEVLVVVADWSEDTRWMTDRTLRGRPFVLLLIDPPQVRSRLGRQDWVLTRELVDVLRNPKGLVEGVERAITAADDVRTGQAVLERHDLVPRTVHHVHGAHCVELGAEVLRLDDIDVAVSPAMVEVLGFLVDRHLEDRADGKAVEAYCAFTLAELADALNQPRTAVQRQLQRFRTRMEARYQEVVLRPLPPNSVLECVDDGWRLSAACLVRRAA